MHYSLAEAHQHLQHCTPTGPQSLASQYTVEAQDKDIAMNSQVTAMCALQIRQAWDFAYQQLIAPSNASESILERIIRLDTVLVDRPRPKDPPAPEQL